MEGEKDGYNGRRVWNSCVLSGIYPVPYWLEKSYLRKLSVKWLRPLVVSEHIYHLSYCKTFWISVYRCIGHYNDYLIINIGVTVSLFFQNLVTPI